MWSCAGITHRYLTFSWLYLDVQKHQLYLTITSSLCFGEESDAPINILMCGWFFYMFTLRLPVFSMTLCTIGWFHVVTGSFTMIDSDTPHTSYQPDVDARHHLRGVGHHRDEPSSTDKMKHKIINFWHNVKYGWTVRPKSSFNKRKPIFLLR